MKTHYQQLKQLVILSGKGGTGKTSISAGLVHLASQTINCVLVDADVDAANLSIVTEAQRLESHPFLGSHTALINPKACNNCGICDDICRYDAVLLSENETASYSISDLLCEGCGACVHQCPQSAITMVQQQDGEWYHSKTPYGHLHHADLLPGGENSGKLVTLVKQNASNFAEDHQIPLMIIDGPPGIGCPVIAASTGADLALLVAEPGVSGIHDLKRIILTLKHFNILMLVCVNKADLSPHSTEEIIKLAQQEGCLISEMVPFDDAIPQAMIKAQPVTRLSPSSPSSKAIGLVWEQLVKFLFQ
jgi:MinD superfamily P-loop ATPase